MVGNWARRSALQQMLNASLKFVVFAIDYRRRFMEKAAAKRREAILKRFAARLRAKVALRRSRARQALAAEAAASGTAVAAAADDDATASNLPASATVNSDDGNDEPSDDDNDCGALPNEYVQNACRLIIGILKFSSTDAERAKGADGPPTMLQTAQLYREDIVRAVKEMEQMGMASMPQLLMLDRVIAVSALEIADEAER
jgi:hypothetical protein